LAIDDALAKVKQTGNLPVPLHLRNAPTRLMAELGYGNTYKYPHDYPEHFTPQQYLPDALKNTAFWQPQDNDAERKLSERMRRFWTE
jgi:putative ATPase